MEYDAEKTLFRNASIPNLSVVDVNNVHSKPAETVLPDGEPHFSFHVSKPGFYRMYFPYSGWRNGGSNVFWGQKFQQDEACWFDKKSAISVQTGGRDSAEEHWLIYFNHYDITTSIPLHTFS
jgi:hypothetical protein